MSINSAGRRGEQTASNHEDGDDGYTQVPYVPEPKCRPSLQGKSSKLIATARERFEEAMRACSTAGYYGTWTMSVDFRDGKVHELRFSDNDSVR